MMSRPQTQDNKSKVAPVVEKQAHPKTTHEAVADLERRLAMLGDVKPVEEKTLPSSSPPPAAAPAAPAPAIQQETKAPEVKGGKAALLVSSFTHGMCLFMSGSRI